MEGVGGNKTKDEQDDLDEETMQPSQLRSFLECKKAKDKRARDYEYPGRYVLEKCSKGDSFSIDLYLLIKGIFINLMFIYHMN